MDKCKDKDCSYPFLCEYCAKHEILMDQIKNFIKKNIKDFVYNKNNIYIARHITRQQLFYFFFRHYYCYHKKGSLKKTGKETHISVDFMQFIYNKYIDNRAPNVECCMYNKNGDGIDCVSICDWNSYMESRIDYNRFYMK
jgi:hypothetical protein